MVPSAFFFKRGEFLMSIATDIEVNWNSTVDNTNKIGLSKTLNQLGANVFDNVDFLVGYQNRSLKLVKETDGYPKSTDSSANNVAFYISNNIGYSLNGVNAPNGVYYRTLLFAVPVNWTWGWDSNLRSDNNQLRIVTKLNLQKNKLYLTTAETEKSVRANNPTYVVKESLDGTECNGEFYVGAQNSRIVCGDIYKTDNGYFVKFPYFIDPLYDNFNAQYGEGALGNFEYTAGSTKMYSTSPALFLNKDYIIRTSGTGENSYLVYTYSNSELEVVPDSANSNIKIFATYGLFSPYYWRLIYSMSVEYWLYISACYGMFFNWNGTEYKPVIENGIVIGYTDNMASPSDIDNWTDVSGHNISPTPPVPPGPGPGYDDDPWSGVSFSGIGLGGGGAFARCYYMTSTELANLRSWMCGINVPEGFNPMLQIIGLSQVPVALSGDAPETVQFINSSAVYDPGVTSRIVDSSVSTQYSMGGPIKYSLGSVDIVRRMQERGEPYLDYSSQIELYLPLIGMFSLDTQAVMGRTIEAEAILDPISGTLAAYAWVSKDGQKLPVAYGSTTISVDLPVTAQQYSVSKAALKQANAQLGTSILSSVATLVAAAVGGGKSEGSNARVSGGASSMQGARGMNSYAQASSIAASQAAIAQTGNIVGDFMQWGRTIKQLQYGNNTAISGSFGGSVAQWSYPFQAYVKINRPRYEKPENYAHTQGVPCVQKKRIGDCTGFIQCIGVDVDNHIEGATDLERQAIQAALSSGIYAGGGGE